VAPTSLNEQRGSHWLAVNGRGADVVGLEENTTYNQLGS
jgi:hypothetical protein